MLLCQRIQIETLLKNRTSEKGKLIDYTAHAKAIPPPRSASPAKQVSGQRQAISESAPPASTLR